MIQLTKAQAETAKYAISRYRHYLDWETGSIWEPFGLEFKETLTYPPYSAITAELKIMREIDELLVFQQSDEPVTLKITSGYARALERAIACYCTYLREEGKQLLITACYADTNYLAKHPIFIAIDKQRDIASGIVELLESVQ